MRIREKCFLLIIFLIFIVGFVFSMPPPMNPDDLPEKFALYYAIDKICVNDRSDDISSDFTEFCDNNIGTCCETICSSYDLETKKCELKEAYKDTLAEKIAGRKMVVIDWRNETAEYYRKQNTELSNKVQLLQTQLIIHQLFIVLLAAIAVFIYRKFKKK